MNLVARGRHVLARHPSLYWVAVLALAAAGASAVVDATAAVDAARREWGVDRAVLVASADISPGEPLAGLVDGTRRPAPTVPAAALTDLPAGAVARQRIAAGEVLVEPDVVAPGPRARVPPGWLAVAVAEAVPSGAAVGDPIIAVGAGAVVAGDGVVVGRRDTTLLVAVPAADAPAVAGAAAEGSLALLLAP